MSVLPTSPAHSASPAKSDIRPEYWMTDLASTFRHAKLKEITLTGSHEAGLSVLHRSTPLPIPCVMQTQKLSIAAQLRAGARCFDLRPTIWSGEWRLGSFSGFGGNV